LCEDVRQGTGTQVGLEDIGEAVSFIVTRPGCVAVNEMLIRAAEQSWPPNRSHRRAGSNLDHATAHNALSQYRQRVDRALASISACGWSIDVTDIAEFYVC
jgi:hypothetical protein